MKKFVLFCMAICVIVIFSVGVYARGEYTIELEYDDELGEATLSESSADEGELVKIFIDSDGSKVESIRIRADSGRNIRVKECDGGEYYSFTMPSSDVTIDVRFESALPEYDIELDYDDAYGEVTLSSETASKYQGINVYITPQSGYEVDTVMVIGNKSDEDYDVAKDNKYTYSFGMPAEDVTVFVEFKKASSAKKKEYNITLKQNYNFGEAELQKKKALEGDTVRIRFDPEDGCVMTELNVFDSTTGRSVYTEIEPNRGSAVFIMPSSDVTVSVAFGVDKESAYKKYEVSTEYDTSLGTVSPSSAKAGTNVIINMKATPNPGSEISYIKVSENKSGKTIDINTKTSGKADSFWFLMPNDDVNVEVKFIKTDSEEYNITLIYDELLGAASCSHQSALSDELIYITAEKGTVTDVSVRTEKSNKSVWVTKRDEGTYVFTMPDDDVTVKLDFTQSYKQRRNIALDYDGNSGSVVVSGSSAENGAAVLIYPAPNDGYETTYIYARDSKGRYVTVGKSDFGYYSFIMPEDDVTISVGFKQSVPETVRPTSKRFADIDENSPAAIAVDYVVKNNIMTGYNEQYFAPNDTTTRAMIAVILWRLEGSPETNTNMPFNDVAPGQWYTEAIRWAAANGIINGVSQDRFAPMDVITREQLVTMLGRYEQFKTGKSIPADLSLGFSDAATVSPWAKQAFSWCISTGIISRNSGVLSPQAGATRAEVAQILMNYMTCK